MAIELSLRVRVSAVELLMLELYSSRIKDFEVYGSASKPAVAATAPWTQAPWELLGTFRAANRKGYQVPTSTLHVLPAVGSVKTLACARRRAVCRAREVAIHQGGRGVQEFAIESASWSRYLLLRMVTHHGKEPVCTLNTVRVHGTTEAEDLEAQLSALAEQESADGATVVPPGGGRADAQRKHGTAQADSEGVQASAAAKPRAAAGATATSSRQEQTVPKDKSKAKTTAVQKTPRSIWSRWYRAKPCKTPTPAGGEAAWARLDQERPFHLLNEAAPVVMSPQQRAGRPRDSGKERKPARDPGQATNGGKGGGAAAVSGQQGARDPTHAAHGSDASHSTAGSRPLRSSEAPVAATHSSPASERDGSRRHGASAAPDTVQSTGERAAVESAATSSDTDGGAPRDDTEDMSTAVAVFGGGGMLWHGTWLPQSPLPPCTPFAPGLLPCYGPQMPPSAFIREGSDLPHAEAPPPPGMQQARTAYERATFADSARAAELAALSPKSGALCCALL